MELGPPYTCQLTQQTSTSLCGRQCPLQPWHYPATGPPSNAMEPHQRCPCLEAPEASKIGSMVYHVGV